MSGNLVAVRSSSRKLIVIRKIMPISFTYDHRALDGAEAARFMNDLRALLEKPSSLLD